MRILTILEALNRILLNEIVFFLFRHERNRVDFLNAAVCTQKVIGRRQECIWRREVCASVGGTHGPPYILS